MAITTGTECNRCLTTYLTSDFKNHECRRVYWRQGKGYRHDACGEFFRDSSEFKNHRSECKAVFDKPPGSPLMLLTKTEYTAVEAKELIEAIKEWLRVAG